MLDRVRDYIDRNHLVAGDEPVLVGVSGGVDSMVLLHALQALGIKVCVAHVNYQLRGEESDGDERMVVAYCDERDIPFMVLRSEEINKEENGRSFQAVAREIRYTFFEEAAKKIGLSLVAVAHHQDDQAETVLLKLFKGSGIEGLSGMQPRRPLNPQDTIALIRPLLACSREEILAYAKDNQVPWREDRTNAGIDYRRNALRHRIMPLIREHFGDAAPAHIAHSASILEGYWAHALKAELKTRLTSSIDYIDGAGDVLLLEALNQQPRVWQTRIVLDVMRLWQPDEAATLHAAEAVLDLLDAQVGRKVVLQKGTVWRERHHLVFRPDEFRDEGKGKEVPVYLDQNTWFEEGRLWVRRDPSGNQSPVVHDPDTMVADLDRLTFPLVLRRWRPGDRMIPFGMEGHKKVSDLLTGAKIPSSRRDAVYVLESEGEIVWVVGIRMADPVKLDEDTEEVVRITFIPENPTSSHRPQPL